MPIEIRFDVPALIILIGIVFGSLLSFFFIKKSFKYNKPNLFMGFLLLTFTLNMVEGWLNYTGLIFRCLHLTNFSEPTNFLIGPLLFIFVSRQLNEAPKKREWLHYIPFVFWIAYCMFFFMQSADFKYNSNIYALGFDLEPLPIDYSKTDDNPLGFRSFVNELTMLHLIIYTVAIFYKINLKANSFNETLFSTKNSTLKLVRNSNCHFAILLVLFIVIKATFKEDFGDYILYIYLTFLLLFNIIQIMNSAQYFEQRSSFLEFPSLKYQKSTLTQKSKASIVEKIKAVMQNDKYYKGKTVSLSNLALTINESTHHVSQAINENLNMSFFELIAYYRIEEAKLLLASEEGKKLVIEEIAERVGYNSKSAFNTSFKKLTNQTPSEFRSNH
ncbi:helix-turn-helix domain-containing protein [Seonamhaeicola marinus]|uniref:AraC family transcriptional regulator n=1 Tax=Seonamhaeicola marinus TaxID=1912246 RepID=A0A5D0H8R5_9FLAO|nr:helix-turn-helix transcriptional regulator [Seonamhaeicola marinus]TYA65992.1 AraC family transcriptional regulator [Seonamhaeicola marinus]